MVKNISKWVCEKAEFLSNWKMTLVSFLFLITSVILEILDYSFYIYFADVVILISGTPLLVNALSKLLGNKGVRKISSSLLITIAMVASVIIREDIAAAEIAFIMAIGEILEDLTIKRAQKGLKRLINLMPETARIIKDNEEYIVPVTDIRIHDIIRVQAGEIIPIDGKVIDGISYVDEKMLSGESLPVDKNIGDSVYCGSINGLGILTLKATNVGTDTSLSNLIKLVERAKASEAPLQKTVDKWASWLVPIALLVATIFGIISNDIEKAVTILVVFCPCALALATPTAIIAAIGNASKNGIIIKSGLDLEKMSTVDLIAFDKTGTLTTGNIIIDDYYNITNTYDERQVLSYALSLETLSPHPLAIAITNHLKNKNIDYFDVTNFETILGGGLKGLINGNLILCGKLSFLETNNCKLSSYGKQLLEQLKSQGSAIVLLAINQEVTSIFSLSDTIKENARKTITSLNELGITTIMLSGDHSDAATYQANKAGINIVYSDLLPKGKVNKIKKLQEEGKIVAMVGDGINDAPSLKTANVGIAMGNIGSDISIESAGITLIGDDIGKLPFLKKLANSTTKIIKINIVAALLINLVAIILSMFNFLDPVTGALVHNGGSIIVILNAALLYDWRIHKKKQN